jgi:AraC family transcriptional activator of mtrCDE
MEISMIPPLDWLSRLLDLVPVRGQLELRCLYGAPWLVVYEDSPRGEYPYHAILSGSAVLEGTGAPRRRLEAGDILVMTQGGRHRLHDGGGEAADPARQMQRLNLVVSENDGAGERFDMLCGRFVVSPSFERWMTLYLPPFLVVRTAAGGAGSAAPLAALVGLMRSETASETLGGYAMLNALSTAMFALVLRLASESGEAPRGLLALAGNPRLAPALEALFRRPEHPWTLPELADLCHMSRATLARHFQEALGRSANELLTDIRMTLAARKLEDPSLSTGAVGEDVGYQSEAAFQRAFKAHMGMTPAAWRRQRRSQ